MNIPTDSEILEWLEHHALRFDGDYSMVKVKGILWKDISTGEVALTNGSSLRDCVTKAMEEEND